MSFNCHALVRTALGALFACLTSTAAHALSADQVRAMSIGDTDDRATAIAQAAASGDAKALDFFKALLADEVKTSGAKVFVVRGDKARDAATDVETALPTDAEDVVNSNRLRREIDSAAASLKLLSPDPVQRAAAVREFRDGPMNRSCR